MPKVIAGPSSQTFDKRPSFAAPIARIIAQWSYIEANLCSILAYLLSTEAAPVMGMIGVLRNSSTQIEMIEAAAEGKLYDPELAAVQAVLYMARKCASKRNRIAHHVWAFCDELPDAMILIDPVAYLDIFVQLQSRKSATKRLYLGKYDAEKCFVYKDRDFNELLNEMDVISTSTALLINYLERPRSPLHNQMYIQLTQQPGMEKALLSVAKNRPRKAAPFGHRAKTGEKP